MKRKTLFSKTVCLLFATVLSLGLFSCAKETFTEDMKEYETFSFEEDMKYYETDIGGKTKNFVNTSPLKIENEKQAVARARNEINGYPYQTVAFDSEKRIWRVDFLKSLSPWVVGGCCSVYLNEYGQTLAVIPGE